jgi:hypothetical protein
MLRMPPEKLIFYHGKRNTRFIQGYFISNYSHATANAHFGLQKENTAYTANPALLSYFPAI